MTHVQPLIYNVNRFNSTRLNKMNSYKVFLFFMIISSQKMANAQVVVDGMKLCSKCFKSKELSEFYRNKKSKSGHNSQCKLCAKNKIMECPSCNQFKESINFYRYNYNEKTIKLTKCIRCIYGKEITRKEFDIIIDRYKYTNQCLACEIKRIMYNNQQLHCNTCSRYKLHDFIVDLVISSVGIANKKRNIHEIDVQFIIKLWNKQQGRCNISGIKLGYDRCKKWKASINKINKSLDYTEDNIQLATKEFSSAAIMTDIKVQYVLNHFNDIVKSNIPIIEKKLYNLISASKRRVNDWIKQGRIETSEHNIDVDYLLNLLKQQNGRCYYSNVPLTYDGYKHKDWCISLERLNPLKGYIKGNVALVAFEFNVSDNTASKLFKVKSGHGGINNTKIHEFIYTASYQHYILIDLSSTLINKIHIQ